MVALSRLSRHDRCYPEIFDDYQARSEIRYVRRARRDVCDDRDGGRSRAIDAPGESAVGSASTDFHSVAFPPGARSFAGKLWQHASDRSRAATGCAAAERARVSAYGCLRRFFSRGGDSRGGSGGRHCRLHHELAASGHSRSRCDAAKRAATASGFAGRRVFRSLHFAGVAHASGGVPRMLAGIGQ